MIADSRFTERLRRALHEEIDKLSLYLAEGSATDFSDYAKRVGEIGGLHSALRVIDEIQGEDKERSKLND